MVNGMVWGEKGQAATYFKWCAWVYLVYLLPRTRRGVVGGSGLECEGRGTRRNVTNKTTPIHDTARHDTTRHDTTLRSTTTSMPHVEALPNSAAAVAPGWTYVVDTGYDPSKVAINPKNKKRAAAQPGGLRGDSDLSARQQTAIARRIAELERDNDVKQSIPVPAKYANVPRTQNARRIIQYQRQIKHWLDEEDAHLAHLAQLPPAPAVRTASSARRQSNMPAAAASSVPPTPRQATPAPTPAPAPRPVATQAPLDDDALLSLQRSVPPPLSAAHLDALLAAPPLAYAASHAAPPSAHGPPQRHFCDNCGYWGHIKCRKCGARVCGLECKEAHEATRCLKWA